jgi:hypothetical protein
VHGAHRDALALRDRAGFEPVEVAQDDGLAVGLVQSHHRLDHRAMGLESTEAVRGWLAVCVPCNARGRKLAVGSTQLSATRLAREIAHDRRHPAPQGNPRRHAALQSRDPGVLAQVFGPVRVERQVARQRAHPAGAGQQGLGVDRHDFRGAHCRPGPGYVNELAGFRGTGLRRSGASSP